MTFRARKSAVPRRWRNTESNTEYEYPVTEYSA